MEIAFFREITLQCTLRLILNSFYLKFTSAEILGFEFQSLMIESRLQTQCHVYYIAPLRNF